LTNDNDPDFIISAIEENYHNNGNKKKKKPVKRQAERRTTSWKWNVKIKIKILSIFLFSLLSRKIERWTVEAKTGRQTESSGREEEEDHSSTSRFSSGKSPTTTQISQSLSEM
jgi:hypothetical protein